MGKGVALEYRLRYPQMFERYATQCENNQIRPGVLTIHKETKPWILNFPTKNNWKHPSKLEYIEAGLEEFCKCYREWGITSIAFPKLGTTSGKLSWNVVEPVMQKYLSPLKELSVEIYSYKPDVRDSLFLRLVAQLKGLDTNEYKQLFETNIITAERIREAVTNKAITGMIGFQDLPGIGAKTLERIYFVAKNPDPQGRLF